MGASFASPASFYYSPLADVIPAEPTGQVLEQGFRPQVTEIGRRHPVTAGLPGEDSKDHPWGRWFRQIDVRAKGGATVMTGIDGRPLLQLERIGKGRAALIASDQMWLWSRGFDGGGPQAELLRRLAHWLMKEPELEEEDLRAEVEGNRIKIVRQSLDDKPADVVVTAPSGKTTTLKLAAEDGGRSSATLTADELGLYRATDGTHTALAAVGPLNPIEFADYAGAGAVGPWAAFKSNGDYVVTGVRQAPLLPAFLVLLAALGALALAWRREGR